MENDIKNLNSEKLAEIIITFRYLGLLKEQSILAMQELMNRRNSGDGFQYEDFIEKELKSLPNFKQEFDKMANKSTLNNFNLGELLKNNGIK